MFAGGPRNDRAVGTKFSAERGLERLLQVIESVGALGTAPATASNAYNAIRRRQ